MTVFRRAVYERLGGFDETLRTNEDYDYWLRAAAGFARAQRPPTWRLSTVEQQPVGSEVRMLADSSRLPQAPAVAGEPAV